MVKEKTKSRRATVRPAWVRERGLDAELVAVISGQFKSAMAELATIQPEDSRTEDALVLEMAEYFQAKHTRATPSGNWPEDVDFFIEVQTLVERVVEAMRKEVNWADIQHCSMYGDETVFDLLERHPSADEIAARDN